jgi:hypothetical protein
MRIKKISIATITLLALAISSVTFAANDILDELDKQINGSDGSVKTQQEAPKEELTEANVFFKSVLGDNISKTDTKESGSLNELEDQFKSLEASIKDDVNPDVVISTIKDKKITPGVVENTNDQAAQDIVFMRNIPEGTRFTVTKDFTILPLNRYVIFHNGEKVIESPLYKNPTTTFCYIELKASGKARILKTGRQFAVTKNETTTSTLVSKNGGNEKFKIYQSKIFVDNDQIKWISCYASFADTDSRAPLSIKDLRIQTNGAFKIEFPAYEEI